MKKSHYLYSHKWTKGYTRTFWKPNANGYTVNLDEAGLYSPSYSDCYPVWDGKDIRDFHAICRKDETISIYIHKDDVEKLGKKMTCILN